MQSVFNACASGSYICIYHRHHCRTIWLYICFIVLKIPPPNENSTNCEVRAVIRLLSEFLVVSRNVFYEIVTARLKFRKLRSRWVPKILGEAYKTKNLARHSVFFNDIAKCNFFIVEAAIHGWHLSTPGVEDSNNLCSENQKNCVLGQKGIACRLFASFDTFNASVYSETLQKLHRAIRN